MLVTGLKDTSSIPSDVSLGDLGLDSLMGVEVKQVVERMTDLIMPMSNIRALTFRRLAEIQGSKAGVSTIASSEENTIDVSNAVTDR